MADLLPELPQRHTGDPAGLLPSKADRDLRRAELDVYRHQLKAAVTREKDLTDTDVLEDCILASAESELRVLQALTAQAAGSAAALEIVARKVELMDSVANRRLTRRLRP